MSNEIAVEASKEAAKQLAKKAAEFLEKIVNKPLSELGDLWTDEIRYFRFKNQVDIMLKAKKLLEDRGIQPQNISLKTLAPLIEYSSWEENLTMQEKWASLLANAANPLMGHDNEQSYVEILNQMSPIQANILDLVYDHYLNNDSKNKRSIHYSKDKLVENIKNINPESIDISIENLYRLNLLKPPLGMTMGLPLPISKEGGQVALQTTEEFRISLLGIDFVKHCRCK